MLIFEIIDGNNVDSVGANVLADDAIFLKYHSGLSTALTDLGSALHMSIASKCKLLFRTMHFHVRTARFLYSLAVLIRLICKTSRPQLKL